MANTNFYINTSILSGVSIGLYDYFKEGINIKACLADGFTVFIS